MALSGTLTPIQKLLAELGQGYVSLGVHSGSFYSDHPGAPGFGYIEGQVFRAIEKSKASKCRNPRDKPGQYGCSRDHSFEVPRSLDFGALTDYCRQIAELFALLQTEAVPELGANSPQSFYLQVGKTDASITTPHKLPDPKKSLFTNVSESQLNRVPGATPEAAVENLINRLKGIVIEEVMFHRLMDQLKEKLADKLHPNYTDRHPYLNFRQDGQIVVTWAVKGKGKGPHWRHAAGPTRGEAVAAALHGKLVCDHDAGKGCVLKFHHRTTEHQAPENLLYGSRRIGSSGGGFA